MKAQHTPGPWKIEHDYKPFVIHTADHIVCAISGTAATVPEAAANAALIAAAPETAAERDRLLEVNKELLAALREINGLAHSCVLQRAPSDDQIIAEHIEEVRDIARAAISLRLLAVRVLNDMRKGERDHAV